MNEHVGWRECGVALALICASSCGAESRSADSTRATEATGRPATSHIYFHENARPRWSPDSSRLAFESKRGGQSDLFTVHLDGSGSFQITNSANNESAPSWSPNGNLLAFISDRSGTPEVHVIEPNGANERQVTSDGPWLGPLDWLPQGPTVVIARKGSFEKSSWWTIESSSGRSTKLFEAEGGGEHSLSPDGRWLAFEAREGAVSAVMLTPLVGGEAQELVRGSATLQPSWAPDGKNLAFVSEHEGDAELFLSARDGTTTRRLTEAPGHDAWPRISPNGKHIAWASRREGHFDLYVSPLEGRRAQRLTHQPKDALLAGAPEGVGVAALRKRYDTIRAQHPGALLFAPEALSEQVYSLFGQGQLQSAIQLNEMVVDSYPEHTLGYRGCGDLYDRIGWAERAVACFVRAAALAPEDPYPRRRFREITGQPMPEI